MIVQKKSQKGVTNLFRNFWESDYELDPLTANSTTLSFLGIPQFFRKNYFLEFLQTAPSDFPHPCDFRNFKQYAETGVIARMLIRIIFVQT